MGNTTAGETLGCCVSDKKEDPENKDEKARFSPPPSSKAYQSCVFKGPTTPTQSKDTPAPAGGDDPTSPEQLRVQVDALQNTTVRLLAALQQMEGQMSAVTSECRELRKEVAKERRSSADDGSSGRSRSADSPISPALAMRRKPSFHADEDAFPRPPNRAVRAGGVPVRRPGDMPGLELGPRNGLDTTRPPDAGPDVRQRPRRATHGGALYGPTSPIVKMSPRCEFFQISNDFGVPIARAPRTAAGPATEHHEIVEEAEPEASENEASRASPSEACASDEDDRPSAPAASPPESARSPPSSPSTSAPPGPEVAAPPQGRGGPS